MAPAGKASPSLKNISPIKMRQASSLNSLATTGCEENKPEMNFEYYNSSCGAEFRMQRAAPGCGAGCIYAHSAVVTAAPITHGRK